MALLSNTIVIERFRAKHGDRYDYSNVDYKGSHELVEIFCHDHSTSFNIKSYHFWNGHVGCPECIKQDRKETNLARFGVENTYQSEEKKDKIKRTNLAKYGVENAAQSDDVKAKMEKTNMDRYGVANPYQAQVCKDKMKVTSLARYGTAHPFQSEKVQLKARATWKKNYGVEHPMQNREVADRQARTSLKKKEYVLPSGMVVYLQGYEPKVLNYILANNIYCEQDFNFHEVPSIRFGSNSIYFPDFYIPQENLIIEVKSWWTYCRYLKLNLQKKQATKALGFNYSFYIWDNQELIIL